jgi:peptidoglycan/LPS O-acetylase OafA/YrhL
MSQTNVRYYWIDWIRFLSALTVVLVHVRGFVFVEFGALPVEQKSWVVAIAYSFTRIGNEAVIVFFVLSGFLVGGAAISRMATGSFRSVDYAIDRFTRIMVPLVPALTLTAIVALLIGRSITWRHLIGNLLFLQGFLVPKFGGNVPLWSLAYEAWFYVLVLGVGVAFRNRHLHLISAILIVFVGIIFTYLSPTYLFCWLIGAYAYVRRPQNFSVKYLFISLLLSLYAIIAIEIGTDSISVQTVSYKNLFPSVDVATILLSSGIALFLQNIILITPKDKAAIRFDMLGTRLAAFSYTLYLIHYPVIEAVTHLTVKRASRINLESIWVFFIMVMVCLVSAFCLYWLFERQTPMVRRWMKDRVSVWSRPEFRNTNSVKGAK